MVLWCNNCGALMGVREPLSDWTVDRNAICLICADLDVAALPRPAVDTATAHDVLPSPDVPP